ncbi:uncharacterized protein [Lepeophtheirus salmonis]|uniref:uncharacterized protein n=1 Tax=Lepeophtheirus salmonis TaxID=72036 RepID=UPI001AE12F90|nr:uncharacterized protein LOC121118885 [Lepeophtheirus salmonis]
MKHSIILFSIYPALVISSNYPANWIKNGECLDFNEAPLEEDVVPGINTNVIKVMDVETVELCSSQCFEYNMCRFFTFYGDVNRTKEDCQLIGFNLKAPCFELKNKCVLLIECIEFSSQCRDCSTGIRPLSDMKETDEKILLFNGDIDNQNYLESGSELMSQDITNNMEILTINKTCLVESHGLIPRIGSVGVYTKDKILNCGGYSSENFSYLTTCLALDPNNSSNWMNAASLSTPRAYASSVNILERILILGGYDSHEGFLSSVETYKNGTWSISNELTMLKGKSHFCALTTMKNEIVIAGGWNGQYLKEIDLLKFNENGTVTDKWITFPVLMKEPRSDAACVETQIGWERGILIAGGYDRMNTWKGSIEFYSYDEGKWKDLDILPMLSTPRHYHGMSILNSIPIIFGGWNNGALSSIEFLDGKSDKSMNTVTWRSRSDLNLTIRREKFGYTKIPSIFKDLKC